MSASCGQGLVGEFVNEASLDLWSKLIRPALEAELSGEFNELWAASVGCGAACAAALCEITRKKVGVGRGHSGA